MIFVTVGTHEQQFDRLLKKVDNLKEKGILREDVFIQKGFSTYKPQYCQYENFLSFNDMIKKIQKARMVITHGGPGSIMSALYNRKIPIAVPRQKSYAEHVDDHQIHFVRMLEENGRIIAVYDIEEMEHKIQKYNELVNDLKKTDEETVDLNKRVRKFVKAIDKICQELTSDDG